MEGGSRRAHFDAVLATALAKAPAERFAHAAAFREALTAALGQAPPPAVSAQAVYALPGIHDYAPTEKISLPAGGLSATPAPATHGSSVEPATPTHWDPAVLAKMEATLAKHVGPLAAVLVRRAARECHDLPALYTRLGEQITHSAAREAFLAPLVRSGTLTGTAVTGGGTAGSAGGGSGSRTGFGASGAAANPAQAGTTMLPSPPVSEALVEQAQRLLTAHMGPIARVVVKRALERTRQRAVLFALLVEAAPESARVQLRADLDRLS